MNTTITRIETKLDRIIELLTQIAANPAQASAQASTHTGQPTFCGFVASWQTDLNGYPSYVIDPPTGEIAQRREKQGDVWWSVAEGETYRQILRIAAGESLPPAARWNAPAAQQPQPDDDDDDSDSDSAAADVQVDTDDADEDKADADTLRRLHKLGRQIHGSEWEKIGPQRILVHSDGRATSTDQLTYQEVISLFDELNSQQDQPLSF